MKITLNNKNFNLSKSDVIKIKKNYLDKKDYYVILKNFDNNPKNLKKKTETLAKYLGKIISQNKFGKRIVEVKPNTNLINKLSIKKKKGTLRYHQTNLGGSIHSDGPQLNFPPRYILMACLKQADTGGSSIITYANDIYNFLKKKKPNYLKVLKENFLFERRGFNYPNQNVFKKPIFEKKKNFFRFRYLREYIEKGYKIKKINIKPNKIKVLNFLDKLLKNHLFQKKYKLNKGDIIILNNNMLAHGRTKFRLSLAKEQRTLIRIWVR